MAKKAEATVEERLRALYDLQLIDSRVDEIRNIRGELPLEVRDLEDDVAGLNTRLEKLNDSLNNIDEEIDGVGVNTEPTLFTTNTTNKSTMDEDTK